MTSSFDSGRRRRARAPRAGGGVCIGRALCRQGLEGAPFATRSMFHSYLIHQSIDLLLAAAGVLGICRFTRARGPRWLARFPALARTRFRRFVALVVPLTIVLYGAFTLLCLEVLSAVIGPFFWEHWREPVSVRFLGLGAAFYAGLVVLPVVGTWLAFARESRDDDGVSMHGVERAPARALDRALSIVWLVTSAAFLVDSLGVEPRRLVVETTRVALERWPADARPIRIVVLSDLQTPLLTDRE